MKRFLKLFILLLTVCFMFACKKGNDNHTNEDEQMPSQTIVSDDVVVYSPANGTTIEENILEYIPNQKIVFKVPSAQTSSVQLKSVSTKGSNVGITNFNTKQPSDLLPGMCISIPPNTFTPNGALLKITDVQVGTGSVAAMVKPASWDDVVKEAAIEEKKNLFEKFPETQGDVKIPIGEDFTLIASFKKDYIKKSAEITLSAEYKLGTIPGTSQQGKLKVIGKCELAPSLDIRVFHKNGMGLPDIFDFRLNGEMNLKLDVEIAAKFEALYKKNIRIMEIPMGGFPLGPTPIIITPTIILSLEIGATGEAKLNFNIVDYKYKFDCYAGYEHGKWNKIIETSKGEHVEHDDFKNFKLKASVYGDVQIGLYFKIMNWDGIELGVGFGIKPQAELEYKSLTNEIDLEVSATASLFGEFNLYVLYLKKFEGKVRADLAKWLIYKLNVAYNPKDDTDLGWGLVAYYPFNGNANDMSGNGNNGTVDGATLTADRHGKANSAYYFDGQSRIEVPNSNSLKSMMNDYSISLWTKSSENNLFPLCKSSYLDFPIHFRISVVDKMVEAIANGNNFQFTNLWQINQWNHIALIYSGDICRLFLNNNEVASPVVSQDKYPYSIDNILYIGQDPHGWMEHHIGEIDDIRIYNRALTSDELNALYNENSSGSGSGGGGGSSW